MSQPTPTAEAVGRIMAQGARAADPNAAAEREAIRHEADCPEHGRPYKHRMLPTTTPDVEPAQMAATGTDGRPISKAFAAHLP
jgi:hypothetical protein